LRVYIKHSKQRTTAVAVEAVAVKVKAGVHLIQALAVAVAVGRAVLQQIAAAAAAAREGCLGNLGLITAAAAGGTQRKQPAKQ
jgi:hypothetical protein